MPASTLARDRWVDLVWRLESRDSLRRLSLVVILASGVRPEQRILLRSLVSHMSRLLLCRSQKELALIYLLHNSCLIVLSLGIVEL